MLKSRSVRTKVSLVVVPPLVGTVAVAMLALRRPGAADADGWLFLGIVGLTVLLSVFAAGLVARSLTRPLRRLAGAARALADDQLPALVETLRHPDREDTRYMAATARPVPVDGDDEIARVAEAFNTVQDVTLDVAKEQSAMLRKGISGMFVHLARRNGELIDRQIAYLDDLEADERDPDHRRNLLALDHYATRMRRNVESLLVLAGETTPRRRGGPVPMADVVRAAVSEVEERHRVDVRASDNAMVEAAAAYDLAHVLAELLENGLDAAPQNTTVSVTGRAGRSGGYVLSVSDAGPGLSRDRISACNAILERPPIVGLDVGPSLGLIVVGRLAQRLNVSVRLAASADGGVDAVVGVPSALVVQSEPDSHGNDGAVHLPVLEAVGEQTRRVEDDWDLADVEPDWDADRGSDAATVEHAGVERSAESEPDPHVVVEGPWTRTEAESADESPRPTGTAFEVGLAQLIREGAAPGPVARPEPE